MRQLSWNIQIAFDVSLISIIDGIHTKFKPIKCLIHYVIQVILLNFND
jgi:hypothetical protein